jgi:3-hydroxybutyryl-CoA dehydrogenase
MADVRTIAVIGAGAAGRELARISALAGYRTIIDDLFPGSLDRARSGIRARMEEEVSAGRVSRADAEAALARLEYSDHVDEAAREADAIFEATADEMESLLEIFSLLDRVCRPNTVLIVTSHSLAVADLASMTYRAADIAGLRLTGQDGSRKATVIRTAQTAQHVLDAVTAIAARMAGEVEIILEAPEDRLLLRASDPR